MSKKASDYTYILAVLG